MADSSANKVQWGEDADANLRILDPAWAEQYLKTCSNPWENGILSIKTIELICVGLAAACTSMKEDALRRHIRSALQAGASRDEILMLIKMGSVMSIHSLSLGAPILLEEAKALNLQPQSKSATTPACDKMKSINQWNDAWNPFFEIDPVFTDQFMGSGISIYASGLLEPKTIELISIAFDASITHMYAPGTRRHIKNALKAGATIDEVMEVLKVCVCFGIESCRLGTNILQEEISLFQNAEVKVSRIGK